MAFLLDYTIVNPARPHDDHIEYGPTRCDAARTCPLQSIYPLYYFFCFYRTGWNSYPNCLETLGGSNCRRFDVRDAGGETAFRIWSHVSLSPNHGEPRRPAGAVDVVPAALPAFTRNDGDRAAADLAIRTALRRALGDHERGRFRKDGLLLARWGTAA